MNAVSKRNSSLSDVAAALKKASTILLVSHFNPDADALGSSCGLAHSLREVGKSVTVVNESIIPERFYFIPGSREVQNSIPEQSFDAVVVTDCGVLDRTSDKFVKKIVSHPLLINLDHHHSNDAFGVLNVVDESACSTSEIVYSLIREGGFPLSKVTAECLYTGILGDTGSFTYSCTTIKVFKIAQDLLAAGVHPAEIATAYFDSWDPRRLRLYAAALNSVSFHRSGEIAEIIITPEMFEQTGASPDDSEGIVERARGVNGVRVSFVATVLPDVIKVSLRARDLRLNLANVAMQLGGGGHRFAAAFRWRNSLTGMREKLLALLGEEMERASKE